MAIFYATVEFVINDFEAEDAKDAEEQMQNFFNQLGDAVTDLRWDDVEFLVFKAE